MTAPASAASDRTERAHIRREGRALIVALHSAMRAMRLYPIEHQAVQRAVSDIVLVTDDFRREGGELDFRVQGEYLFVNGTRLRLDLSNYTSFGHVLTSCRNAGIGAIRVIAPASIADWLTLLVAMQERTDSAVEERFSTIVERIQSAGVIALELSPLADYDGDIGGSAEVREAAKRTYTLSVALTRDVINSVRMGRAPSLGKIKRAVQVIVDQVLTEEASLVGLTTLRDYDEYTYTHSVNVCIFSVALGRRLGMSKLQLYELGMAALMHDIGKCRVPAELLQKSEGLTDAEWEQLAAHPWLGVLALFQLRGQHELPYRAMTVAYEHHMKHDMTGYPRVVRPRAISMTSRIVAVADGYDAATSRRAYQSVPWTPPAVLQEMRDNPRRGMDPVVVKAFINLLGIYPPGTLVVLDTLELAIVKTANPSSDLLSRPTVVIVSDPNGHLLAPPLTVDLAAQGPDGQFARTIIKTADPERYGIRISDYLL